MSEDLCRVGIVALVTNSNNEFLMERRTVEEEKKKTWSFIAGGKKAEESIVEAAEKEVKEEVAAKFIPQDIIGLVDHDSQRDDNTSWTVVGIKGKIEGTPVNNEPNKRDKIEWKNEIPENLHPTSEMIQEIYHSEKLHQDIV